jgi:lysozyme
MSRLKKGSAAAVVAVSLIGGFEGLRQNAYPDPATGGKPWTVCYGETLDVHKGDYHSIAECKAMLVDSLQKYANGISACVTAPMPDDRYVALVSFAYNVGVGAACKSSVVRLINQGHTREGCDALMAWNKAAGVTFPGLTKRRAKERALCLRGLD